MPRTASQRLSQKPGIKALLRYQDGRFFGDYASSLPRLRHVDSLRGAAAQLRRGVPRRLGTFPSSPGGDNGILRAAFDDDLASLAVFRHQRSGYVQYLRFVFDQKAIRTCSQCGPARRSGGAGPSAVERRSVRYFVAAMGLESRELSLHCSSASIRKKGREVRQKANVILRSSRRTCFVLVLSCRFLVQPLLDAEVSETAQVSPQHFEFAGQRHRKKLSPK